MSAKTKILSVVGLLAMVGVLLPTSVSAAGVPLTPDGAFMTSLMLFTSILISILNTFTWFLFMMLDYVLNPDWIFGTENGGLTTMLQEIWQLCRDLVNLSLALALIYRAMVMIIKSKSEEVSQHIPKFVMALVLVNFSWFIPRAVFDVSQVIAYTVYQIPSLIGAEGCIMPADGNRPARPCEIVINYAIFDETDYIDSKTGQRKDKTTGAVISTGWKCVLKPLVCIQTATVSSAEATKYSKMHTNVMNGLFVNHARLQTLVRISDPRPLKAGAAPGGIIDRVAASLMTLVKMVVILMFHIALFFPLLAMVAAFFIRIPILWVTMAFMPLVALSYVFEGSMPAEFDPKEKIWKEFLKVVFLPAKVAVPFTIGFVMVNAGAQTAAPAIFDQSLPLSLFSGVRSTWQLMWMGVAMFIIWKFSFEALKSGGETTNMFGDRIKGFGQQAFQLAGKGITHSPIIPWGSGKASMADFGRALSPETGLNNARAGKPFQLFTKNLDDILAARGGGVPAVNAEKVKNEMLGKMDVEVVKNIKVDIKAIGDGDPAAAAKLDKVLLDLKTNSGGRLKGVSEAEAIEGILQSIPDLTPAQAQKVRDQVKASRVNKGKDKL